MNPLNNAGQGANSARHFTVTNENAPGATEALKLNQPDATIDRKEDLRNAFKKSLLGSLKVDVDAVGEVPIHHTETAANEVLQEAGTDALIDPPEAPVAPVAPPPSPTAPVAPILRYKLWTGDQVIKLPPVQWRIKNRLPSRGLAMVFGQSASGKSFLVLDMLQSLAFGHDWFGHKVKQCSVTYVALEGEAGVAGRIKAYLTRHGSIPANIHYVAQPFNISDDDDIEELAEAILAVGAGGVVVVDTLSRAIPGLDENGSKDMGLIIAGAKKLQERVGGLLLLIHHTGKDTSKGVRGHSSLFAALDCAIEVKRTGDHREWVIAKSKDGADGATHPFELEVVHLGTDSDGDAETSCVVVPNQSAQALAKKRPTLGSNQAIALKALEEPLRQSVDIDKDGAPHGVPCLDVDQALAIVVPLMPGGDKHKKERAEKALAGLVTRNVVGIKGDWLWVN